MKKMKLFQLIFIILIFSSCSTIGKRNILYGKCNRSYLACTQFELKKDKTFEFYVFMDVGGGNVINGNWDYGNGDTLKLNTIEQPKIARTYYEAYDNSELNDKVKIQIQDFESPLIGAYLEINEGETICQTNIDGICYINIEKIESIKINYLGYIEETILIESPNKNYIEIYLKDSDSEIVPKYFVDKLVVVNKNEITIHPNYTEKKYTLKRSRFGKRNWK